MHTKIFLIASLCLVSGLLDSSSRLEAKNPNPKIFFAGRRDGVNDETSSSDSGTYAVVGQAPLAVHLSAVIANDQYTVDLSNSTKSYLNLLKEVRGRMGRNLSVNTVKDPCRFIEVKKPDVPGCKDITSPACAIYVARSTEKLKCYDEASSFTASENLKIIGAGTVLTTHYQWNFGDTSQSPKPPKTTIINYNQLEGFNASKIYDHPGVYTVRLTITNSLGETNFKEIKINVLADTRTKYYIAANGNGDGLSTQNPMSLTKLISSLNSWSFPQNSNFELLFKKGDAFNLSNNTLALSTRSDVVIGAYPEESSVNPPILYSNQNSLIISMERNSKENRVVVQDLTFDNNPNRTVCTSSCEKGGVGDAVGGPAINMTVRRNEIRNLNYLVNLNNEPSGVLVQDNKSLLVTGLRSYLAWMQGEDITIIGNEVVNIAAEHVIRGHDYLRVLLTKNILSNQDRREIVSYWDDAKAVFNMQAGQFAYISQNLTNPSYHVTEAHAYARGPSGVCPLGDGDGQRGETTRNVVFERNDFENGGLFVCHGAEDIMIRNNIFRGDLYEQFKIEGHVNYDNGTYYDRGTKNVTVLNNTFINYAIAGHAWQLYPGSVNPSLKGNLISSPKAIIGKDNIAPVIYNGSSVPSNYSIQENLSSFGASYTYCGKTDTVWQLSGNCTFQTLTMWNNQAGVINDRQGSFTFDDKVKPQEALTEYVTPSDGIFNDYYGHGRRGLTTLTAGAVERSASGLVDNDSGDVPSTPTPPDPDDGGDEPVATGAGLPSPKPPATQAPVAAASTQAPEAKAGGQQVGLGGCAFIQNSAASPVAMLPLFFVCMGAIAISFSLRRRSS